MGGGQQGLTLGNRVGWAAPMASPLGAEARRRADMGQLNTVQALFKRSTQCIGSLVQTLS